MKLSRQKRNLEDEKHFSRGAHTGAGSAFVRVVPQQKPFLSRRKTQTGAGQKMVSHRANRDGQVGTRELYDKNDEWYEYVQFCLTAGDGPDKMI